MCRLILDLPRQPVDHEHVNLNTHLPLDDILVVAFEHAVAAPLATRHLADLGARVIKIERPHEGDFARDYDDTVNGLSSHFVWLNRGKESVVLDLKSEHGKIVMNRLTSQADIVVHNYAPGAANRLGIDADTLRAERPELIVATVSGYGSSGDYRARKAYDLLIQAETGLISATGTPDQPVKTGIPTADIAAGIYAFSSVLAALFRRERTGIGSTLDISMFEAVAEWLSPQLFTQLHTGNPPARMAMSHASIAPYGRFQTADGALIIGVQNSRGWRDLVETALGRSDLVDDPRFRTNALRVFHRRECDNEISLETLKWQTESLESRLFDAGVPFARINSIGQLAEHRQLSSRRRWRQFVTPDGNSWGLLPPMNFADLELPMNAVPSLGQHTDAVLLEMGISAAHHETFFEGAAGGA